MLFYLLSPNCGCEQAVKVFKVMIETDQRFLRYLGVFSDLALAALGTDNETGVVRKASLFDTNPSLPYISAFGTGSAVFSASLLCALPV